MNESNKIICPECNSSNLQKMISKCGGIIVKGREANQYKDIKAAKYWRDKNGVRHPVTAADGYTTSASVNKQTATPAEIQARKNKDEKLDKQKRLKLQKQRADNWNKANKS